MSGTDRDDVGNIVWVSYSELYLHLSLYVRGQLDVLHGIRVFVCFLVWIFLSKKGADCYIFSGSAEGDSSIKNFVCSYWLRKFCKFRASALLIVMGMSWGICIGLWACQSLGLVWQILLFTSSYGRSVFTARVETLFLVIRNSLAWKKVSKYLIDLKSFLKKTFGWWASKSRCTG